MVPPIPPDVAGIVDAPPPIMGEVENLGAVIGLPLACISAGPPGVVILGIVIGFTADVIGL
jgi:hypothetical protein